MRKRQFKNSGVYCIENIINGKKYIGSSSDIYRRKSQHFCELRKNRHYNTHLQSSFNKYGEKNFVFKSLQLRVKKEYLFLYERNFIIAFDSFNNGYNQSLPDINCSSVINNSTAEKLRRKAYIQHYGKLNEDEYQKWKEEKIKKANQPKTPIEVIKKRARKKFGKPLYGICIKTNKILKKFDSVSHAIEILGKGAQKVVDKKTRSIKGLRLISSDMYDSSKDYRKIRKVYKKKGKFKGYPIKVKSKTTGKEVIYSNKEEAIEKLGLNPSGVRKVLYEGRKTHKGYYFELIK